MCSGPKRVCDATPLFSPRNRCRWAGSTLTLSTVVRWRRAWTWASACSPAPPWASPPPPPASLLLPLPPAVATPLLCPPPLQLPPRRLKWDPCPPSPWPKGRCQKYRGNTARLQISCTLIYLKFKKTWKNS